MKVLFGEGFKVEVMDHFTLLIMSFFFVVLWVYFSLLLAIIEEL